MICKKVIVVFSLVFVLAMASPMAPGAVLGAQLCLDASNNPAHPKDWTNLGTARGFIPGGPVEPPILEQQVGTPKKYYTAQAQNQVFASEVGGPFSLHLEDFTVDALVKRNGDQFQRENQIAGFHSAVGGNAWTEGAQFVMLGVANTGGQVWIYLLGANSPYDKRGRYDNIFDIGLGEWRHIAFVYNDNENMVLPYLDGERIGDPISTEQDFDPGAEMDYNSIFCQQGSEDERNFNGSISVFRVYGRMLSDTEIRENFENPSPACPSVVNPSGKIAGTWGIVKAGY